MRHAHHTATPSNRRRGIIFDLDGTLADTLDDLTNAVNVVLGRFDRPAVDRPRVRAIIGHGLRSFLRQASDVEDGTRLDELVEAYRPVYRAGMLTNTRLYPGVPTMLDALCDLGLSLAVLSNKPDEFTVPLCAALLSHWRLAAVAGAADEEHRKPDPRLALELAAKMRCRADDIFFVGDSTTDLHTGRNAGMHTVAVTWGYRDREELLAARPEAIIDEPRELLDVVKGVR